ncbi:MAG TPA: glycosyl hydrolase 115 family protein, partial [Opitutales bacterium]|nr:glycosyl hydrolase 115 family protein [Opitutales bacterium]
MKFGDPTFRYRGWFINDEDLLNRFSPDPLQENPLSLAMLDRILETLLRLRGNMIIPGTFNFPDERAWELATRRGLALHMHHILVVGLNTFRWPDDVPFSYLEHPEIMEDYWRACIQQFKGKEVVWTVGYRGKGDQAFWTDEPNVNTPEARGGVISDAIARQVELIREVDPEGMIVTNLWKEGVQLMRDGHLEIPEEVVGVWPDNGFGLVRDGGTVEKGQGVYYHTAMLNGGANQLTEMVTPSRIYRELGRFVRAEATEFYLLNLSDVRPVPLSSDCTMRFVWNAEPYLARSDDENMDLFLADWSHRQFEEDVADEVAAIYKRYFNLPHMDGDTWDTCRGDNHMHWKLRFISRRASEERAMKEARDAEQFVKEYEPHVVKLLEDAEALAPRISEKRASFYLAHVLTQIRIHLYSMRILGNYAAAKLYDDVEKAELALKGYDDLRAAMRPAETDKWAAWYFGECLVSIEANRGIVRKLVAELKGEPIPTVRKFEGFPFIYQYQERFSDNFPFLYEQSKINAERE